jgi:nitrite reductase (cytochrome c-552)
MLLLVVVLAALATVAIAALLVNIFERKQEAKNPFYRVVELNETVDDPAVWGKNFPSTVDMQRTKYGGSEAMPHSSTQADPRSVVARSKLEQDPRLKVIWSGYSFSADYRERRGHAYMLEESDLHRTPEIRASCSVHQLPCVDRHEVSAAGQCDLIKGFNTVSDTHMTYPQIRQTVKHSVACIDCHDPTTMQLRVTRSAFLKAFER